MPRYDTLPQGRRESNRSLSQYANSDASEAEHDPSYEQETTTEDEEKGLVEPTAAVTAADDGDKAPSVALDWPKKLKRRNLLLLSFASFIVSIGQSIILPAIEDIARDLGGDQRSTAAALTLPLIVLGVMNAVISPYSDAYGRKKFHIAGLFIFTAASVACGFSQDIYQLIGFRLIQAFGAAAPAIVGSGSIADMFAINERGQALGLFLLGPLVGPVMGPIFGGLLASADFGEDGLESWRLIFFVVAGMSGLLWLVSLVGIKETMDTSVRPRHCVNPFSPLAFLRYIRITLIVVSLSIGFAGFFAINISFPIVLDNVYFLTPITVGLCYLPFGAGLVVGAVIGGRSADKFRRRGGTPEHRLLPSLLFIPLNGLIIIGQGWVFQYSEQIHLSVLLIMSFFLGLTFILPRPGTNTYVIERLKDDEGRDVASAATGVVFGVMLPFAAVIAQLSVMAFAEIGYGLYLTIIGAVMILSTLPIGVFAIRDIRHAKRTRGVPTGSQPDAKAHVNYEAIN